MTPQVFPLTFYVRTPWRSAAGPEIVARVNEAIAEATADGTIAKIMAKYDQ